MGLHALVKPGLGNNVAIFIQVRMAFWTGCAAPKHLLHVSRPPNYRLLGAAYRAVYAL